MARLINTTDAHVYRSPLYGCEFVDSNLTTYNFIRFLRATLCCFNFLGGFFWLRWLMLLRVHELLNVKILLFHSKVTFFSPVLFQNFQREYLRQRVIPPFRKKNQLSNNINIALKHQVSSTYHILEIVGNFFLPFHSQNVKIKRKIRRDVRFAYINIPFAIHSIKKDYKAEFLNALDEYVYELNKTNAHLISVTVKYE